MRSPRYATLCSTRAGRWWPNSFPVDCSHAGSSASSEVEVLLEALEPKLMLHLDLRSPDARGLSHTEDQAADLACLDKRAERGKPDGKTDASDILAESRVPCLRPHRGNR